MTKRATTTGGVDIYQQVTDLIIEKLEQGVIAWRKTWFSEEAKNYVTGKPYRGINIFVLMIMGAEYERQYYLTYNQAKKLGGQVRKGEKGIPITYWNFIEVKDPENPEDKKIVPMLKKYTVFNIEQVEGVNWNLPEKPEISTKSVQINTAEGIIKGYKNMPKLVECEGTAAYSNTNDVLYIPKKGAFESPEAYYTTMFHECGHSTGHESRLNRDLTGKYGSSKYAKEELIAEMTACYLCAEANIIQFTADNNAAYIANWLKVLKEDNKMLIQAAGKAQRAADYILNRTYKQDKGD